MRYFFTKKPEIVKTEKSKILNFFLQFVYKLKNNLWDNSLMLCGSPNIFLGFSDTFLIFKILSQKNIFRKKGCTAEISGEKNWKKSENLADRPKSARKFGGIKTCVLGGYAV